MGKRIALSNGRRLVDDVIRMAARTPLASVTSDWDVSRIAKVRRMVKPRISWNVLLMKAHAQACNKMPLFKCSYVKFPWAHLYQHEHNVAMLTMSREYKGEQRLLFARFNQPENYTLLELQQQYDHFRKAPIDEIKQFRHQIRFAKFPGMVRRFAWWALFNTWPRRRGFHMGTFGMSISGHKGTYGTLHLGPNTTTLGVDPLPRKGISKVVLTFDHRVIDGLPAISFLNLVQHLLNTAARTELAALAGVDAETFEPLHEKADQNSDSCAA